MKPDDLPGAAVDARARPAARPRTRLRPIVRDDHAAVMALFARHCWPLRSRAGWEWSLFDSPAREATGADAGWVLEHGDAVVGFLGNLPVLCRHDGAPVWGATCTSYLVDDDHRAHSTRLMRAFAAQPGAAFVWSATANPHSAPVYRGFRFRPSQSPQSDQRLRWVAHEGTAARALAARTRLPGVPLLADWAGSAWGGLRRWTRPIGVPGGLSVERLRPEDLLLNRRSHWPQTWSTWAKALSARPGLQVDRSAGTLAWRLSDPDLTAELALWSLRDAQGRMLGMALARKLDEPHAGTPRAELMDWALSDHAPPAGVRLLLDTVLRWARSWRLACVDAKRWTGATAEQLAGLGARTDPLPPEGVWLMVNRVPGLPELPDWPDWSMTGTDSDDWFCTHRLALGDEPPRWVPPPAAAASAAQARSAAESSAARSDAVSTTDGSNRSMSTA
jgi:hypothetical protein